MGAINRLMGRKPRKPNAALLALTLNNMTQGVVLLDTNGRHIVLQRPISRHVSAFTGDREAPERRNRIDSGSLRRDARNIAS